MGRTRNAVVPQTAIAAPRLAPQESKQHIFREHQADNAPASGTQCHAHGHLALPGASTSQHEVCGGPADRQQQEQHDALARRLAAVSIR